MIQYADVSKVKNKNKRDPLFCRWFGHDWVDLGRGFYNDYRHRFCLRCNKKQQSVLNEQIDDKNIIYWRTVDRYYGEFVDEPLKNVRD